MQVTSNTTPLGQQLRHAFAAAGRHWRLALALYLPTAVIGLLTAVPVFLAADAFGRLGPWTTRLAMGDIQNVLFDLSTVNLTPGAGGELPPEIGAAVGNLSLAVLLLLAGLFLQGLAYNLLAGGVLEGLSGRGRYSFWRACRRWGWPMVWFGLLSLPVFVVLAGAGLLVLLALPGAGEGAALVKVALAVGWLSAVNGLVELGRADMVARDNPRALRALGRALAAPFRRPGLIMAAAGVWLALGLLGAVYTAGGNAAVVAIPLALSAVALVAQQLVAFGGAWLKVLRLAVALGVAQAGRPEAEAKVGGSTAA